MQAPQLVRDRDSQDPAPRETRASSAARERRSLLFPAGTCGNAIRFLMPITTPPEVLDEGPDVLEQAFTDALL